MHRRSPFILWLHVMFDMWKLLLLTTAVLDTVIAFALAIKPLADGKLSPQDAVKFMALATIPGLQYVLPFAACFGATLAYHRLAVDNELTAAHAGGISHRSLLMPAVISGVVLACGLWGLSNYAIPKFFRSMARLVSEDATRMIVTSIERGEAITMGDALIYADKVVEQGPDEASGAYDRLWLSGLLVVRLDKEKRVVSQGSAKTASVWMRRIGGTGELNDDRPATQVILQPKEFVGVGQTSRGGGEDAVKTFIVPNAFSDNPKFLTFDELRDLRTRPENMDFVDKLRRSLALALAQRDTIDAIRVSLRDDGKAEFVDPFQRKVVLKASDLRATRRDGKRVPNIMNVVPPKRGQQIVVEQTLDDGKVVRQSAGGAYLRMPASIDPDRPGVYLTIQMQDVAAEQVGADGEVAAPAEEVVVGKGEVKERPVSDLAYPGSDLVKLLRTPTGELVSAADARIATRAIDVDVLAEPRRVLTVRVADLMREVMSKEQERLAMSLACLVMVVLGAVMAMRLRDSLPLTVYVWAFFPALLCMVAISGGQQLTHGHGAVGLLVLYSGVVLLGVFALVEFVRVARH